MIKKFRCIECPKSCALVVDMQDGCLAQVSGQKCSKGAAYAKAEIENPQRILTGTVLSKGLSLKMIPVRTQAAIPKAKIAEAAAALKKIVVHKPLRSGDVIDDNFLGLGTKLIATRSVS